LNYLEQLEAADVHAYNALEYLEQPTDRDIRHNVFDWREVARRKPVLLDEGLTDLSLLEESRRQGYSGLALKTCKGHSMLLACAAWAHQHNMLISLQDLTNPGIALIHAALVGSHLPTINGAELNSPQFTPAANEEFLPRLQDLFEPTDGLHRLPNAVPDGLGASL
jgi:L-alanine-DL-glutamate epimerase-like enolase superfamily enzyme